MAEPITWTNETRKLSELVPWESNPRVIARPEADRLSESLTDFGQVQTIAIGPDNEIYDGHQRQLVWSLRPEFGPDYEVDVRVSSRPLTKRERQKLVIFLHRGTNAEWDWGMLADDFSNDDLREWGFDDGEGTLEWDELENEDFIEDGFGPPAMELLPHEKYNYVLLTFTSREGFDRAIAALGLKRRQDATLSRTRRVGLVRVMNGLAVVERLEDPEHANSNSE